MRGFWLLWWVGWSLVILGCGDPALVVPRGLQAVHIPLDGAEEVPTDVRPRIYFADPVSVGSVDAFSVQLREAGWDGTACQEPWAKVTIQRELLANDQIIEIGPPTEMDPWLQPAHCYLLFCTTELRGAKTGPLAPILEREIEGTSYSIGLETIFRTVLDGD